jgi:hypothetical protein
MSPVYKNNLYAAISAPQTTSAFIPHTQIAATICLSIIGIMSPLRSSWTNKYLNSGLNILMRLLLDNYTNISYINKYFNFFSIQQISEKRVLAKWLHLFILIK